MKTAIRNFGSDTSGASAVIFSLVAVALVAVAGLTLDLQRGSNADNRLQASLDSAALAGAKALEDSSLTDAEVTALAEAAFAANMAGASSDLSCDELRVNIDRLSGRVRADTGCRLPTTAANLVQVNELSINEASTARAAITKLDVAMMLDVSGSMSGEKIEALKDAAGDAIDILVNKRTGDRVRVAFNSYSTSVNAGSYLNAVTDPDDRRRSGSCVSERAGAWAWRDEAPGNRRWLGQDATRCPASSVEPLTSEPARLKAAINDLVADGLTAGHIGVAWAWYLISPEWSSVWPAASAPLAYDAPNSKKAVILMTDGEFNTAYARGQGNSAQQAKKLCRRMRDEGVIVYAVAFDAPWAAKRTLEDCAGSSDRYFEAGNSEELRAAYRVIASQLSNLSLTE